MNKANLQKIFLAYTKFEAFRNRGCYWVSMAESWTSIGTLKDAFLVGGIAKLTLFKNLSMEQFVIIVFIFGVLMEFLKMLVGWVDFRYGMWEKQNEWAQKHQKNNPFNYELRKTVENICEKVGAKPEFKDYDS